uniref:Uncharacterized protein n=1 Tax=Meloidogyne enterolobii TaxID=390850 RepID=A0A6V7W542_MELEN|nr:unnamed protein product [Meloidogyne enterolobii]
MTGEVVPMTGEVVPMTGEVVPMTGEVVPMTGEVVPTSGDVVQTTGKNLSTDNIGIGLEKFIDREYRSRLSIISGLENIEKLKKFIDREYRSRLSIISTPIYRYFYRYIVSVRSLIKTMDENELPLIQSALIERKEFERKYACN